MRFYLVKTPALFRWLFPSCIWRIPNEENKIFLTFDDGPNPVFTKKIIAVLKKHRVPATFFCIGRQVKKHPELFDELSKNYPVGNHTLTHVNGWKESTSNYSNEVEQCQSVFTSFLFRPPYGRIKFSQINKLKSNFKIIMWDVLGADFDASISPERIEKNILKNTESGSIIVLHDNPNYAEKMLSVLPSIIEKLKKKGFVFSSITPSQFHPT